MHLSGMINEVFLNQADVPPMSCSGTFLDISDAETELRIPGVLPAHIQQRVLRAHVEDWYAKHVSVWP